VCDKIPERTIRKGRMIMRKWISVKDRLPERVQLVLCWNGGTFSTAILNENGEDVFNRMWGITHWMPLPEPPKSEKEG